MNIPYRVPDPLIFWHTDGSGSCDSYTRLRIRIWIWTWSGSCSFRHWIFDVNKKLVQSFFCWLRVPYFLVGAFTNYNGRQRLRSHKTVWWWKDPNPERIRTRTNNYRRIRILEAQKLSNPTDPDHPEHCQHCGSAFSSRQVLIVTRILKKKDVLLESPLVSNPPWKSPASKNFL
jgi:hypothetical protein